MQKKTEKKLGNFFIILGVLSAIITFLEGRIYYNAAAYPDFWVRWLLIIQNTIKAFAFRSDIGLRDMSKALGGISKFSYEWFVGYAYTVAVFTAPYCTLAVVYKVLEKFFRFGSLFWRLSKKDKVVVIFGYNDEVKELLETKDSLKDEEKGMKYRIHLVSKDISRETEVELLKKKIKCHCVDFLKLLPNQLGFFMKRMEADKVVQIVLFEESTAKNFSLYQMFHDNKELSEKLNENVRFICRCEDVGTRRIIEDYHDNNKEIQAKDLELIGIHELRAREVLTKHSLHEYWRGSGKPAKDWKLHLLIVGFGKLGQQILLQSMNLGVADQNNEILIDVVDFAVDNKKSIFANYFSDEYVQMDGDVFKIPQKHADGAFTIRFHNMDIRYKKFGNLLQEKGDPNGDGIYTYVAICVENMDVSLHCMSEIENYLHKNADADEQKKTSIGVRMESNRQMANYLSANSNTYKNVFVIEETDSVVSLDELLHDEITAEAKEFNYIYSMMKLKEAKEYLEQKEKETKEETTEEKKKISKRKQNKLERKKVEQEKAERKQLILEKWESMPMFKRNSNLAIALHETTRNELLDKYLIAVSKTETEKVKTEKEKALDAELKECFGENGTLLQDRGNVWLYKNEDALLDALENGEQFVTALNYAKTEHRRWCYFMASCGWKRLDSMFWEKKERDKANSCMCPWEELATRVKPEDKKEPKYYSCKYDLMPLLMKYKENRGEKYHE